MLSILGYLAVVLGTLEVQVTRRPPRSPCSCLSLDQEEALRAWEVRAEVEVGLLVVWAEKTT